MFIVIVTFDGIPGKVTDREDNLITVLSPVRVDIKKLTNVEVVISNNYNQTLYSAEKKLNFIYQLNAV
jgi:hypothetical protein